MKITPGSKIAWVPSGNVDSALEVGVSVSCSTKPKKTTRTPRVRDARLEALGCKFRGSLACNRILKRKVVAVAVAVVAFTSGQAKKSAVSL